MLLLPSRTALAAALLALACAGPPPPPVDAQCPAPGPRPDAPALVGDPGDPARGERLFGDACQGCHATRATLRAPDAPPHAPRLDCPAWLAETTDGYLYDAINRGPGRFGHGGGPPLGERLVPADIADLVSYLRSLAAP